MNRKLLALGISGLVTFGTVGVGVADYISQTDKSQALVSQLGDIARQNQQLASSSGQLADNYRDEANSYQNTITNMYQALGLNVPQNLGNISNSELDGILKQYVNQQNSSNRIEERAREEVFAEINKQLGTNFNSASAISNYISDLNNQRDNDNSASNTRYLQTLKEVYGAINQYPSDDQLLSKSGSEVYSDVQGYIQQTINSTASSSQQTAEQYVVQQLAGELGIEANSLNDLSNQIQSMKNNYNTLQQEYNNASSGQSQATADMEQTIQSLREQIQSLGHQPCR